MSRIEGETEDYILNVNETEYINHISDIVRLEKPELLWDEVYADSYEADIPVEYFPQCHSYGRYDNDPKSYKRPIIKFIVPCSGNTDLLHYHPSRWIFSGGGEDDVNILPDSIVLEFVNFSNNTTGAEDIKRQYESSKKRIQDLTGYLLTEIDDYNLSLEGRVRSTFEKRKQRILNRNNLMASLGVPLKKNDKVSTTYSIPKPEMRKKIHMRPAVHEQGFKPEPSLSDADYRNILKLINDVGKNFERHPNVYNNKGEEALRDHILMMLDPHFEMGGASGETFNKTGKTDILLKYDSSAVFVAECKFWHGEKGYLATIDQLLNYLTWRDTKAAVILFVTQKDFSAILEKIKTQTEKHTNYLGFVNMTDENWFNFRFHINGDPNREVKLTVLLYHIP